jgi:transposase
MRLELENHIRGTLKTFGIKLGRVTAVAYSAKVKAAIADQDKLVKDVIVSLLAARDALMKQQQALSNRCASIARKNPVTQRLMTVPGVGIQTALAFQAEIDDPLRFRKSCDVGAHLGLTPKRYASGETDWTGGITKCGNGAVRTLLFEASVTMLTRSGPWSRLKSWAVRLAQQHGFKYASTALARKLAVVLHRMWVTETDFVYGDVTALQAA